MAPVGCEQPFAEQTQGVRVTAVMRCKAQSAMQCLWRAPLTRRTATALARAPSSSQRPKHSTAVRSRVARTDAYPSPGANSPLDCLCPGSAPTAARELPDPVLEVGQGFVAPAYFLAPHREAQKVTFSHRCHLAFDKVDREFEAAFKTMCDAFHDPLAGTLAFHQDEHVIRVSY